MRIALLAMIASTLTVVLALAQDRSSAEPTPQTLSWEELQEFFQPPEEFAGQMGAYRSVLTFDDGSEVTSPDDWPRRRQEILDYWHGVMGQWPEIIENPQMTVLESEQVDSFTRHKVRVELAYPGRITGDHYLLVPDGDGPFPAVLVVFYGGARSAGVDPERPLLAFGADLARRGFVTLCIGPVSRAPQEIQPLSWLAYMAANGYHLLANRDDVEAERVGVMGHSFGGKWALFASCLYEKFACAVWVDPGIVWNERDPNANYWDRWYLGFDSNLEEQRPQGRVSEENPRTGAYKRLVEDGRDLHELHALMAPRPFLVLGGGQDRVGHWVALNHTIALNRFLGYDNRVAMTIRGGHSPTEQQKIEAYSFLEYFLKSEGD